MWWRTSRRCSGPVATSSSCPKRRRWWPSAPWPISGPGWRGPSRPTRPACSDCSDGCTPRRPSAARHAAEALATAARAEGESRGPWAGPVGWVDGTGDGEWMIGIRSALLHADGLALTLRAGSGIVAASDPDAEAAETDVKLATVLNAVLPGASVQLR